MESRRFIDALRKNSVAVAAVLLLGMQVEKAVAVNFDKSQTSAPVSIAAVNLRCDMLVDPINVSRANPRLSWNLNSSSRNQFQAGYEVLVASSESLLTPEKADLWQSGRQKSDASIQIAYQGKPLSSNQQVFWTVRLWNKEGVESPWAKPATWTVALLKDSDWKADWICSGADAETTALPVTKASWIWYPEKETITTNPIAAPPNITRYFRYKAHIPANAITSSATLYVSADNEGAAYLNGKKLGDAKNWRVMKEFSLGDTLRADSENVFAFSAKNTGDAPNAAGLVVYARVPQSDGKVLEFFTDGKWEASELPSSPEFPENVLKHTSGTATAVWKPAKVQTTWGLPPWHRVGFGPPHPPLPIFRKTAEIAKPVKRAIAHICGLGHHKLFINGKPASDDFLDPAWSVYEKTVFYSTYDVTRFLKTGSNAFGVMVGKGYYSTAGDRRIHGTIVQRPLMLIMQTHIEYEDGTSEIIKTDDTWKWKTGPLVHNSILGGTSYDARNLPDGWNGIGYDDSRWTSAVVTRSSNGSLTPAIAPPVKCYEELKPKFIEEPEAGFYVYDFGQNASATPRLKVKGAAGSTITLTYAEQRHGSQPSHNDGKGRVDQSGIHNPNYIEYTLRGGDEEVWFCDFFYTGYQYLELTGGVPEGLPNPDGKPVVTDITSVHVHTDLEPAGNFQCSDSMYERIDQMIDWSVRSNLSHVMTDCPHREKLGWLEETYLMWPSVAYRYDMSRFGAKIARDIRESQGADGVIYTVAPNYPSFSGGFRYTPEWGAAGVFIPWLCYQWYGDRDTLEQSYDSMKAFVDYMRNTSKDLVPVAGLGDWYDYGHGEKLGASRFTPTDLSAMACFYECAQTVVRAAGILGKPDDVRTYEKLCKDIYGKYNEKYYDGRGQYKNMGSPQTANAMSLVVGLVEPSQKKPVVEAIVADMKKRGNMQTSGDIGFRYLLRALALNGKSNMIFALLDREELGSYKYLVNAGWTSMPESWNAYRSYSMNHLMLGHIQEWFNGDLAGIQMAADAPAFKRIQIKPVCGGSVTSASATFQSPYGRISSSWTLEGDSFRLKISVPGNTSAQVHLPAKDVSKITEQGRAVRDIPGVRVVTEGGESVILEVGSGKYDFAAPWKP